MDLKFLFLHSLFAKVTIYRFQKRDFTVMTKEVYIALIQKDIAELDMIAKGLYETELPSPTIIKLAQSKANDVINNLKGLAEVKKIEKPVEEIVPQPEVKPIQVEEKIKEEPLFEVKPEPVEESAPVVEEEKLPEPEPIFEESIPEVVVQEEPEEIFEPIQDLIFEEEETSEMIVEEAPVVEEPIMSVVEEQPVVAQQEEIKEEPQIVVQKEEPKPVKENVKILTSRPVYYQEPEIKFERVEPAPKEEPKPVEQVEIKVEEPEIKEESPVEEPIATAENQAVEAPVVEEVKENPAQIVEEIALESVVEPAPVSAPEPIVESSEYKSNISLFAKSQDNSFISSLATKKIESVKRAISMGDRFRFQRELFANNADAMNTTIDMLDSLATAAEAEEYLSRHFSWDMDDQNVADFLGIVARRFV